MVAVDAGGVREIHRSSAGSIIFSASAALVLLASLLAIGCMADPISPGYPYPPNPSPNAPQVDPPVVVSFSNVVTAFLWIVLMNFAVNLFFFSALFAVATYGFGSKTAAASTNRRAFLAKLMMATLAITMIGAAVDLLFIAKFTTTFYSIQFDLLHWLGATVIIFCSIFVAGTMIMGINLRPAVLIAAVMAALNPLWWWMTTTYGEIVIVITLVAVLFCVKFPVSRLLNWQSKQLRGEPDSQKQ